MNSIIKTAALVKPAAIFARVSTHDQRETSLPSQVSRCKEKLENAGYSVIHAFQIDWTSLDLYSCPEFQQLRSLIKNREIMALAVFDRDRLEAKGLQRLLFMSELKEAGIELVICQGPEVVDGPEGQIVELALAIGKERQVLRARQGSRDGLRDRALNGKPVTFRKVYGFDWEKKSLTLKPNEDYPAVKLIFDLLLANKGYTEIIRELARRGTHSPAGNAEWSKTAISTIVHNPIYAGKYFSLKRTAVEPVKRRGNTYGNSSAKRIPLDQAHYQPGIKIINPPITWEQRGLIHDQLERHQKLASRNAKRDYLLRGRIFCETHYGQGGEPRRYHGIPKGDKFYYACPVGGCDTPYIDGPGLDHAVTTYIYTHLLTMNDTAFYNLFASDIDGLLTDKGKDKINKELAHLGQKEYSIINKLAMLEDERLNGKYEGKDRVIYDQLRENYASQRKGIERRKNELLGQLAQVGRDKQAFQSLNDIRKKFFEGAPLFIMPYTPKRYLKSMGLENFETPSDVKKTAADCWKSLLDMLYFEILIHPWTYGGDDARILQFNDENGQPIGKPFKVTYRAKIALPPFDGGIVNASPGNELRNTQYYPLRFTPDAILAKGERP